MSYRVLITCPHLQRTLARYDERFARYGLDVTSPPLQQQLSEAELLPIIAAFDGAIAGDDEYSARVLAAGTRLKVVSKWGIGLDAIDLAAAAARGIQVFNTPDVFADEVADVVTGYLVLLARQLHRMDQAVRQGEWLKLPGISLRGKTLGIIGVGSIGQAVARRGRVMGMEVLGQDIQPVADRFLQETGLRQVPLDDLLAQADFISLNCNLTRDNRHLLSQREFALMKPGTYIINTARGALIDEAALIRALESGQVAGAALDVFESEPLPADSPLRRFPTCLFAPHNSSNTHEAVLRVNEMAIGNLLKGLGLA